MKTLVLTKKIAAGDNNKMQNSTTTGGTTTATAATATTTTARLLLDENGCPRVPYTTVDDSCLLRKLARTILLHTLFSTLLPVIVLGGLLTKKFRFADLQQLYTIVNGASVVSHDGYYQNPVLLSKLWKLPSAKPYLEQNALEYQRREGYCSLATLRCILHSFSSFPKHIVPEQTSPGQYGPSMPLKWKHAIDDIMVEVQDYNNKEKGRRDEVFEDHHRHTSFSIRTDIVGMKTDNNDDNDDNNDDDDEGVSYEIFLETLRKNLNNNNHNNNNNNDGTTEHHHHQERRVAINYLRPVLFGFTTPKWVPFHFFLGLLGGHFSPVLGLLEHTAEFTYKTKNPLVGVFDVNHKYGGAYLIPAKVLYDAVQAKDLLSTGQRRAMMVLTLDSSSTTRILPNKTANAAA